MQYEIFEQAHVIWFVSVPEFLLVLLPVNPSQVNFKDYMGFFGGSEGKKSACNAGDPSLISKSRRSPGEWNGYPLQYSFLENPMDRGAWRATVHGGRKVSGLRFHFSLSYLYGAWPASRWYFSFLMIVLVVRFSVNRLAGDTRHISHFFKWINTAVCICVYTCAHVHEDAQLCPTLCKPYSQSQALCNTIARQASLSVGFSQE